MKPKPDSPSKNDFAMACETVKRMVLRLADTHRFCDWRIFLDDEPVQDPTFSFDPLKSPPWIIRRADLLAINALYMRLKEEIAKADVPAEDPEQSEGFLTFIGGCIVGKVIMLIHSLLLSYNYYNVKDFPDPGRAPSSYLNPKIVPDLSEALLLTLYVLFAHREQHIMLRSSLLSDLYAVMKTFFDVLAGMLPCEEVAQLREAYDTFHFSSGEGDSLNGVLDRLLSVSRRFAAEEPKWERARANSNYEEPAPVIPNAASITKLALADKQPHKRPRKNIPTKVAAQIFDVHPNTIGNWDKLKTTPPPEYLGREVDEALLRAAASRYHQNCANKKQMAENQKAGLTHKSKEPKSATGLDSSLCVHDIGNFRISAVDGHKIPQ